MVISPSIELSLEHLQQAQIASRAKNTYAARASPGLARRAALAPAAALKCNARVPLQQRVKMQRMRLSHKQHMHFKTEEKNQTQTK